MSKDKRLYWQRRRLLAKSAGVCVTCRRQGFPQCRACLDRRKVWRCTRKSPCYSS